MSGTDLSTNSTEGPISDVEARAGSAALLLRLSMGLLLLAHSLVLKVGTFTVAGTVAYFESIGYPGALAYLVIAGETLAGVALILGVFSRWAALAMVPIMIGAALEHVGNGWVFSSQGGGWEFPVLWTVLLIVQALLGDGRFSLAQRLKANPKYRAAFQYS
jgi:putative oxidoreductase